MTVRGDVRVVILRPESDEWREVLSRTPHDVYHVPEFVAFAARRQIPGDPALFVVEGGGGHRLILPLVLRDLPEAVRAGSLRDATTSRGYPGPVAASDSGEVDPAFVDEALQAMVEEMRRGGIIAAYVRMHPLFSVPQDPLRRLGTVTDHGDAIYVDLRIGDDDWRRQMRHGHRQDINRALRRGYRARVDEQWDRFDDFVALFTETMERLEATDHWRLGADYFNDLREALDDRLHLCVVERDGEVASAALLTEVNGIVEYHLAGTATAHMRASPSKLVVDHARAWARDRGNRVLHLTGSLSRGDTLSHFKRGFSPLESPVQSWRVVSDREAYESVVGTWRERTNGATSDDYFPAYRKPLTAS